MGKNSEALSSFIKNLTNKTLHRNGDITFTGKVIYKWGGETKHETLQVHLILTTFDFGKIRIDEGKELNIDNIHTEFFPDFQKYSHNTEGFLVINGTSPRIGDYEVKIIEF